MSNSPTIHNVRFDSDFTTTYNRTPADPRLSFAAKGLLWYILTREKNWKVHTWQLAKVCTTKKKGNGLSAIKELLIELRKYGYVEFVRYRDSEGKWLCRYDVYPMPKEDFQKMFPAIDLPPEDLPPDVNTPVIVNKELPRKELNKKGISSSISQPVKTPSKKPKSPPSPSQPIAPSSESFDDDFFSFLSFSSSEIALLKTIPKERIVQAWQITQQECVQSTNAARVKFFLTTLKNLRPTPKERAAINKDLAIKTIAMLNLPHGVTADAYNKHFELIWGVNASLVLSYEDKDFKAKLDEATKRYKTKDSQKSNRTKQNE